MTLRRRAIVRSEEFARVVDGLAESSGSDRRDIIREARGDLRELSSSFHRFSVGGMDRFGRWLSRAYEIDVAPDGIEELHRVAAGHPILLVPNHRSYLDAFILRRLLADEGFPPHYTLAGANLAIFPLSVVARRSGAIYIRRSTRGSAVYPAMLRLYLELLVRSGASLAWYVEGGRTRTGKLRAPRLGVLRYLVDGMRLADTDSIEPHREPYIVPVSIVYDQQAELAALGREESGEGKSAESLRWMVDLGRAQGTPRGKAHVRIGTPVTLASCVEAAERRAGSSAMEKVIPHVGIDVSQRINAITPVSPAALITFALLDTDGRAVTVPEAARVLRPVLEYVERRRIPMTSGLSTSSPDALIEVLGTLEREGVVSSFSGGQEPVYWVPPDRALEAAFYRNSLSHWFVNRAVAEAALVMAVRRGGDVVDGAWEAALEIRSLLRFEFFFTTTEEFAVQIRDETSVAAPGWDQRAWTADGALEVLDRARMRTAHHIIGPFLDSYLVLAEHLADQPDGSTFAADELARACVPLARQRYLQRTIASPESASMTIMANAAKLADASGLLADDSADVAERRRAIAAGLREVVECIGVVRRAALEEMAGDADSALTRGTMSS